ncbi:hypothetical protein GC173_11380 [bacterium]|nr:hypothetical protein [bacterium]
MILHPRALARLEFLIDTKHRNRVAAALPPGLEEVFAGAVALASSGVLTDGGVVAATLLEKRIVEPQRVDVVPIQMEIKRTPYTEADAFSVEIDLNRFPLDPRIVREVRVEGHLDSAFGVNEGLQPDASTIMVSGYADRIAARPADGRLVLEGRDLTSLLIDRPHSGAALDLAMPAEELIRGILAAHPSTQGLRLEVRHEGATTLAPLRADANGQTLSSETRDTCWDVISRLAAEMGAVAWVEGDAVVIADRQRTTNIEALPSMVWGRNLTSLSIERGTAGRATPPVVVASWDPSTRRALSAMWPETEAAGESGAAAAVHTPNAMIFRLANVSDVEELRRTARAIWTRLAEADMTLTLETRDVTSVEGKSLLALKPGDSISVFMNESERASLYGLGMSARVRFLERQGYSPAVAQAIAAGYEELAPVYQVREMTFTWSASDGLSVRMECANLITVG